MSGKHRTFVSLRGHLTRNVADLSQAWARVCVDVLGDLHPKEGHNHRLESMATKVRTFSDLVKLFLVLYINLMVENLKDNFWTKLYPLKHFYKQNYYTWFIKIPFLMEYFYRLAAPENLKKFATFSRTPWPTCKIACQFHLIFGVDTVFSSTNRFYLNKYYCLSISEVKSRLCTLKDNVPTPRSSSAIQ